MKIKSLKYNYRASNIMKALKTMHFTVYRDQEKPGEHDKPQEIRWIISVPKGKEMIAYKVINETIEELIAGQDTLVYGKSFEPTGLGYAPILKFDPGQKVRDELSPVIAEKYLYEKH